MSKGPELARTIAGEFLGKYMLRGKPRKEIEETVERFMKEGELLSHGRIVRRDRAAEYGLKIEAVGAETNLDVALWELQTRCENYVQSKGFAKYLIGRSGGINVAVQRMAF